MVTGAAGQLGRTIVQSFGPRWPTLGLTRQELDVTRGADVQRAIATLRPRAIVNCVGFNAVDQAEDQPEEALAVNAFAVRTLARAAAETGATLVHYGSDFVFDGEHDRPYTEEDLPAPRSVYAASKLLGEWFAEDVPEHYVLRVESLFGGTGHLKSSLDLIINSIREGRTLRVFADRTVSPSFVPDVVAATAAILEQRPAPGVYHCVNTGAATWAEVAADVRDRLGSRMPFELTTLAEARLRAKRPRYCALSNEKLRAAGITMPTWQDALDRYLR